MKRWIYLCIFCLLIQGCNLLKEYTGSWDVATRWVFAVPGPDSEIDTQRSVDVITARLRQYGVRRAKVNIIEKNKIEILLPRLEDVHVRRVQKLLTQRGILEFRYVREQTDKEIESRPTESESGRTLTTADSLEGEVLLDGSMITETKFRIDSASERPYLLITFNRDGAERLLEVTSQGVGRKLAIVLDGTILASPVINGAISGGKAQLDLPSMDEEARVLQIMLSSGAYPREIKFLESTTFGPRE